MAHGSQKRACPHGTNAKPARGATRHTSQQSSEVDAADDSDAVNGVFWFLLSSNNPSRTIQSVQPLLDLVLKLHGLALSGLAISASPAAAKCRQWDTATLARPIDLSDYSSTKTRNLQLNRSATDSVYSAHTYTTGISVQIVTDVEVTTKNFCQKFVKCYWSNNLLAIWLAAGAKQSVRFLFEVFFVYHYACWLLLLIFLHAILHAILHFSYMSQSSVATQL